MCTCIRLWPFTVQCGVGRNGIVCCAVVNEIRVENSKVTMGVQSNSAFCHSAVQGSQAACLRSRSFRSDFAARELLCKRIRTPFVGAC